MELKAQVGTAAELRQTLALARFDSEQFREIWLRIDRGPALSALLNGKMGWLMYLREEGDAGFSSRNPAFDGDDFAMIEYRMTNGQDDEFPASWAISEQEIVRALEYFVEHQDRAPFVQWHDDSGV